MILRYDVSVNGREEQRFCGEVLHVDCRDPFLVTFWADDYQARARIFSVVGTGHFIEKGWAYRGTALTPKTSTYHYGQFVWHLLEREA